MNWFGKSPFEPDEDPVEHMIALLSRKAAESGAPLTDEDRAILRHETSNSTPVPDDLRLRVKDLIARLLHAEADEFERNPKSFADSIQWADPHYPNIVALAEEVACEIGADAYPPLRGWNQVKDKLQLAGCGCLVVLVMFAAVVVASSYFGWK